MGSKLTAKLGGNGIGWKLKVLWVFSPLQQLRMSDFVKSVEAK